MKMKVVLTIILALILLLIVWNFSLESNAKNNKINQQAPTIEYDEINATIKSMSDSTEKVWRELVEIKSNDIVFLGERIVLIRKDLIALQERQDKIAKEQSEYFNERILELHGTLIKTQKQIIRLGMTGSN